MSEKPRQVSVALESVDIEIVDALVEEKGLGARGFSAGLRMILREWLALTGRQSVIEEDARRRLLENPPRGTGDLMVDAVMKSDAVMQSD